MTHFYQKTHPFESVDILLYLLYSIIHTNKLIYLVHLPFTIHLAGTDNRGLKAQIKCAFSDKYIYHKIPDEKYSGSERDLKGLKSQ